MSAAVGSHNAQHAKLAQKKNGKPGHTCRAAAAAPPCPRHGSEHKRSPSKGALPHASAPPTHPRKAPPAHLPGSGGGPTLARKCTLTSPRTLGTVTNSESGTATVSGEQSRAWGTHFVEGGGGDFKLRRGSKFHAAPEPVMMLRQLPPPSQHPTVMIDPALPTAYEYELA